ncbi:unnamed protein product [Linum tenue]|uniref:EF-hand domain-containing protein n=2 Tax=Linum tenue TaxID=586396 RepID=A0AAV0HGY9_9ROSI|nr:unnamed protein product [Linum tenue]
MEVLPGEVLSEDQVFEFQEAFCLLDKDGDGNTYITYLVIELRYVCVRAGRITIQELGTSIRSLGLHPSEGELKEMMRQVDVEGKGSIEFGEFLGLMATKMKENEADQELREAFRVFDQDQDGFISPNEVSN